DRLQRVGDAIDDVGNRLGLRGVLIVPQLRLRDCGLRCGYNHSGRVLHFSRVCWNNRGLRDLGRSVCEKGPILEGFQTEPVAEWQSLPGLGPDQRCGAGFGVLRHEHGPREWWGEDIKRSRTARANGAPQEGGEQYTPRRGAYTGSLQQVLIEQQDEPLSAQKERIA